MHLSATIYPRLLLVDDDQYHRQMLSVLLERHGYLVYAHGDGPSALASLDDVQPDVVLLDVQMPGMDGFEVCRQLKGRAAYNDVPVLFMTAQYLDSQSVVAGLRTGGDDYVSKLISPEELNARLRVLVRLKARTDALKAALGDNERLLEQLRTAGGRDSLTGLFNRAALVEHLGQALALAARHKRPISSLIVGIDGLNGLNDAHGHSVGDQVLTALADTLRHHARQSDLVARLDGDAFVWVAIESDLEQAQATADRLRQTLTDLNLSLGDDDDDEPIPISATVAVVGSPDGTISPDALIAEAESALSQAKAARPQS